MKVKNLKSKVKSEKLNVLCIKYHVLWEKIKNETIIHNTKYLIQFIITPNKTSPKQNFPLGRFLGASLIYVVIAQVIHTISAFATMKYYLMPEYFPVWSRIMMPGEGAPPASFYYYSFGFGLISAMFFVLVYWIVKNGLPAQTLIKKGLLYGLLIFLVAGIPGYLAMILLINLPLQLVASWTIESFVIYLINGIITVKIVK